MERLLQYVVPAEYDGKKLIVVLRGQMRLGARLVASLKRQENGIRLNDEHARTIDPVHTGDVVTVRLTDRAGQAEPIRFALDVLYEDDDLLVVNKPAGLAMHPTHNHQGDTLANAVAAYYADRGETAVFRAVGRLDKDTSGVVICAKHRMAAAALSGKLDKTYYAVVTGVLTGGGVIDRPIVRPDPGKTLRAVGEGGDAAVTRWRAIASGKDRTLLEVRPLTGRTHQIRVHFASAGCPLLGDDMYGGSRAEISRQALHCGRVTLTHPVTGRPMTFTAPIPADMQSLLGKLKKPLDFS